MIARRELGAAGAACIALGIGFALTGAYQSLHGAPAAPLPVHQGAPAVARPLGVAFYAQNFRFAAMPSIALGVPASESIVRTQVRADFVERAVLAFDREPKRCEQRIDRGTPRGLHVFALPTPARTFAIAFFLHGKTRGAAPVGADVIACTLGDPSPARLDPSAPALAPVDGLIARARIEYLTRPDLRGQAASRYPARDKPLVRFIRSSRRSPA